MGALSALSGVKPGLKTTELIVTVIFGISQFLVSIGVIHTGLPDADRPAIQAAAALGVALIVLGYAIARGIAKRGGTTPLAYIHEFLAAANAGDADISSQGKLALTEVLGHVGLTGAEQSKAASIVRDLDAHTAQLHAELDAVLAKIYNKPVPSATVDAAAAQPPTSVFTIPVTTTTAAVQTAESGPAGVWPTTPVAPTAVTEV